MAHSDKYLDELNRIIAELRARAYSHPEVLAAIGLQSQMTWREDGPPIYDENAFITYTEQAYHDSAIAEMDETYRMHSHVLLHKATGLRVKVSTSENYYGDEVDYKVDDVVVQLVNGREEQVVGLDAEKQMIRIRSGEIPFTAVDKRIAERT